MVNKRLLPVLYTEYTVHKYILYIQLTIHIAQSSIEQNFHLYIPDRIVPELELN